MQEKLADISKRRGFTYPSFEIYGGVSGFVDYGPMGVRVKKNIEDRMRRAYVVGQGCLELECPTLSPEDVWVASGHVDSFMDLMVECGKCGEGYRADKLLADVGVEAEGKPAKEVGELLSAKKISCLKCKGPLSEPFEFKTMFATTIGTGRNSRTGYLRPETAQSTYLPFRRLWEYARRRLPFGVIQVGHSFRNEISPRQGMIRLREFNQAEIQFFMDPQDKVAGDFDRVRDMKVRIRDKNDKEFEMTVGEAYDKGVITIQFLAYQLAVAMEFFVGIGIDGGRLTLRQHGDDERAFYSSDTWDVEYASESYGRIELVGIADRTDYDLTQHMKASKQDMQVSFDGRKFTPHVIEVAYGIDRPFYCVLESCLREEGDRTYFSFPADIAPYTCGVYSLVKKDGLLEKAEEVGRMLREAGLYVYTDHAGSIGKRYARADEVGVPYCATVDYESLEDGKVTVRDRDTKEQKRVLIEDLPAMLRG